jgi:hypothetical protein
MLSLSSRCLSDPPARMPHVFVCSPAARVSLVDFVSVGSVIVHGIPRTILRGLVVFKLLAFADEGASARMESPTIAGRAGPFAGKSRGGRQHRPHLRQPAGARPREPDSRGSRTTFRSSRCQDYRVLRRPSFGRGPAQTPAWRQTTEKIDTSAQRDVACGAPMDRGPLLYAQVWDGCAPTYTE